jgi:hypothetical protein
VVALPTGRTGIFETVSKTPKRKNAQPKSSGVSTPLPELPVSQSLVDAWDRMDAARAVISQPVREGFDPATGMHRDTLRWALRTLFPQRPTAVDLDGPFAFWVNSIAGLGAAFLRAGGPYQELQMMEFMPGAMVLGQSFWEVALSRRRGGGHVPR